MPDILITFRDEPTTEDVEALEAQKVTVVRALKVDSMICSYATSDFSAIRKLPFVTDVKPYDPAMIIDPAVAQSSQRAAKAGFLVVKIGLVKSGEAQAKGTLDAIKAVSADVGVLSPGPLMLHLSIKAADLQKVAAVPNVRSVSRVVQSTFDDLVAYDVLVSQQIKNSTDLKGEGELIAIDDSGFHQGVLKDGTLIAKHPAFGSRVLGVDSCMTIDVGKVKDGSTWSLMDRDGHGTHVAGCALGLYSHPDRTAEEGPQYQRCLDIQGIAPKANLLAIKTGDSNDLDVSPDLNALFFKSVMVNGKKQYPRIHNCSFSADVYSEERGPTNGRFMVDCRLHDTDDQHSFEQVLNLSQELLITVSAGNNGHKWLGVAGLKRNNLYRQVHDTSAARSALTVGWTYNARLFRERPVRPPWAGWSPQSRDQIPVVIDVLCDDGTPPEDLAKFAGARSIAMNPTQVALMSSKGPTTAGFLKPEVVAPGAGILSAKAYSTTASEIKFKSGGYCKPAPLGFKSGSSHAAPQVAGCAAVIREALRTKAVPAMTSPSGALLKAIIINGAVDLKGGPLEWWDDKSQSRWAPMPASPNNAQGFGQVNLENSLACVYGGNGGFFEGFIDPAKPLIGWPSCTQIIPLAKDVDKNTLRVTLAFMDDPDCFSTILKLGVQTLRKNVKAVVDPDPIQALPWDDATEHTKWLRRNQAKQVVQRVTIPMATTFDSRSFTVTCNKFSRGDKQRFAVAWAWTKV